MIRIKKAWVLAAVAIAAALIIGSAALAIGGGIRIVPSDTQIRILYLGVGQIYKYPVQGDEKINLKSYDKSIITVDESGNITAVAKGTAKLKAGNERLIVEVADAPQELDIDEKALSLGIGEEYALPFYIPESTLIAGITYSVSDSAPIEIDEDGRITAVAQGKTTVTAETYNGHKASCEITVADAPYNINVSVFNDKLYVGTVCDLKVSLPEGSAAKGIQFESDNYQVLSVGKNGKLSALSAGTANITATAYNGVSASCKITVSEKPYYIRTDLDTSKPMVAFTFDDGPNSASTGIILKTLEEYNCSATFFIVGERMNNSNHAWCVKEMVEKGFELGNHTFDHNHYGTEVTVEDITKCTDIMLKVTGQQPALFRPTGGFMTDTITAACGAPIILWNIDTEDWKEKNADDVYQQLISGLHSGDVVLMHDLFPGTAEAVERAVPVLVKEGYQIVNVSELAYYYGVTLENGKAYYSF